MNNVSSFDQAAASSLNAELVFLAEPFTGRKIGTGFLARTGWQVVAYDRYTKRRRAVFKSDTSRSGRTPCKKLGWVAAHYRSGRSAADEKAYQELRASAISEASRLNGLSSI